MKEVQFDTNYNNKLHCNCFCHVAYAPVEGFLQSDLPLDVLVSTKDNSFPPFEATMFNLIRFPWQTIPEFWAQLSHGMNSVALIELLKGENKWRESEMCVYFYMKKESISEE